ncbi:YsnF/AvaK domain-containing protein [Corallococcus sp. BB11-1]|uniref:YsnF/AvaK domain-containing protein n=1 Tax=Corallococcus sp. BB11-1 TaxID=2996783 RepID=UPI00226DEF6D|nr:YsnF/AvaK domain-containing protein [Corallococcus sp. BB11-1]MCY1031949.1 YsnF/AvaK domain-containing protein [Corallococcus sp. BB11-1]
MIKRNDIKEGMTVRSSDGEKLGKVFAVSDAEFHIEKGMFFPKDYLVRYAEVSDIRNGEIYLNHGREALSGLSDAGSIAGRGGGAGVGPGALGATGAAATGTASGIGAGLKTGTQKIGDVPRTGVQERDLRANLKEERIGNEDVTLRTHHEELEAVKRQHRAGEAQVRKVVVEEMRTVTVPLRHEEVEVVRRAANPNTPDTASFQEETIRIPLNAEDAELQKRVYADEDIDIRKRSMEETRSMEGRVRHEEVEGVTVVRTADEDLDDEKRRAGYKASPDVDPIKRR